MKTQLKSLLPLCLLLILQGALAQKAPIKLGDVSKADLQMKEYPADPDADAVVLCDYGFLIFNFDVNQNEWTNTLKRICRIKIFNDDGYHWATEKISLYDDNKLEQHISQIKGYTHNLENGKIVKSKLEKDDIITEKSSEYYDRVSITMPNVKEGSVIEFSYTVMSNYITILDRWNFQQSIPVKWSEYIVSIPEYLNYMKNSTGFGSFYQYETSNRVRSINWTQSQRSSGMYANGASITNHKIDYIDNVFHWIAKDLPGLQNEKFVGNYRNYLLGVDFQLSGYKTFSDQYHNVLNDWHEVVDKFLNDYENFGPNMRKRNFYKEITDKINAEYSDPTQRASAVYSFVSEFMKWDSKNGIIPDQNIRKTFEDRTGSCADINALLVSMLRAVEVEADPVIISTIDHGLVHPTLPIIDKYNYLIARATFGDQYVLLDATEKKLPFGILPRRCLNLKGYAISENNPGWVELKAIRGAEETTVCLMTLLQDGTMTGTISNKRDGYSGISARNSLRQNGEEKYIENFKSRHADWSITSMEIDAPDAIDEAIKEKIDLELSGGAESLGDIIYINPIISGRIDENPLKQEERMLPIEFIVPEKNTYMMTLKLPEGYTVDELPQPINLVTPDRTASLRYAIQQMGDNIQVMNVWQITESFYVPSKFNELKEFFAILVSKHNEQIVLKKDNSY